MIQKQTYQMKKKRQIQRKRHRNATILIIFLFIVVCVLVSCGVRQKPQVVEYETYIAKEGDTIWEIAQSYYDDSIDIRMAVHQIKEINGISDSTIYNGDSLLVPVYSH